MRNILIIDNHLKKFCNKCSVFREDVRAKYDVAVRAHDNLPKKLDEYSHIVLTGGGGRVAMDDPTLPHLQKLIRQAVREEIPILGICFGHQMIAAALEGHDAIESYVNPETGWFRMTRHGESRLLAGLPHNFYAFEHHHDDVVSLPKDFMVTASSARCKIEAYEPKLLNIYGVQFHPEISKRTAKTIITQHITRHLPSNWLGRHERGRMPFSRHIGEVIFENFYATERPKKKATSKK